MDPINKPNQIQLEPQEHIFNKVLKFTLVVLILASIGLGGFMFSQIKNIKDTPNALIPTTIISPTAVKVAISPTAVKVTISPAPQSVDPNDINVGSVEADLKDIGIDVNGLQ